MSEMKSSYRRKPAYPKRRPVGRTLSKRERVEVNRMIDRKEELKFLAAALTGAASTSTPVITGIIDNAQGITDSEHVGDGIDLNGHIELRVLMQTDNTGDVTQANAFIRVIMFQWHPTAQSGGATEPGPGDVLLSSTPSMLTFYNHDQRQNYTIIYDEVFALSGLVTAAGTVADSSHIVAVRSFSTARLRKHIQYVAASSTTMSNGLYLMTFSNLAADAQNPSIAWGSKVFYRDS